MCIPEPVNIILHMRYHAIVAIPAGVYVSANNCAAIDFLQENLWLLPASVVTSYYDGVLILWRQCVATCCSLQ